MSTTWGDRAYRKVVDGTKVLGYRSGLLPSRYQLYSAIKMYELEVALAQVNLQGGETVVDVCCGTGIQSQLMAHSAARVLGVDVAWRQILDARWHVVHSRYRTRVGFLVGAAEALPLRTGGTDVAICLCAIEHVRQPREALGEIWRILRPGGRLCITADSLANVEDPEVRRRHQLMYGVRKYYNAKSLRELVESAGLRVDKVCPILGSQLAVEELERWHDPSGASGFT